MPVHLRPSAPTAADALLCGDPARALTIAQRVMVQPRMSNHHRGLWGYYGRTPCGTELTVQATGIGGPSAVVVLEELVQLGLRRAVRIGTCTAPGASPAAGSALIVRAAIGEDGTSAALGHPRGSAIEPDAEITAALVEASGLSPVVVRSRDLHEGADEDSPSGPPAPVGDLQTAALLAVCRRLGVAAGAALVVGASNGRRLDDDPMEAALIRLAGAATAALHQISTSTRT